MSSALAASGGGGAADKRGGQQLRNERRSATVSGVPQDPSAHAHAIIDLQYAHPVFMARDIDHRRPVWGWADELPKLQEQAAA
jgi:hypothetical protein